MESGHNIEPYTEEESSVVPVVKSATFPASINWLTQKMEAMRFHVLDASVPWTYDNAPPMLHRVLSGSLKYVIMVTLGFTLGLIFASIAML